MGPREIPNVQQPLCSPLWGPALSTPAQLLDAELVSRSSAAASGVSVHIQVAERKLGRQSRSVSSSGLRAWRASSQRKPARRIRPHHAAISAAREKHHACLNLSLEQGDGLVQLRNCCIYRFGFKTGRVFLDIFLG